MRYRSMMLPTVLLWVALPSAALDEHAFRQREAQLDKEERELLEAIGAHNKKVIAHHESPPDPTDKEAVDAYSFEAQKLNKAGEKLEKKALDIEKRQTQLLKDRRRFLDEKRLAWLEVRIKKLEKEIEDRKQRVERTQALLRQLRDQSSKDVKAFEDAAKDYQEADIALAAEVLDLVIDELMTNADLLSKALNRIDLKRFPGKTLEGFRKAVEEAQQSCAIFGTQEGQHVLQRLNDAKTVLQTAPNLRKPADVDKAFSTISEVIQFTIREVEGKTKLGQALLKKAALFTKVEKACGFPVLQQTKIVLDLGERAVNLWVIRGSQIVANREVHRIMDTVERRNRIIKEFSPGGSYHKTYKQEVIRLKMAREEKAHCEDEMQKIRRRLAASD